MLICERLLEMGVGMLRFFPSELLWLAVQYRDENCEIFPYLSECLVTVKFLYFFIWIFSSCSTCTHWGDFFFCGN